MSWKKNAISYIMWFLYVLIIEALVLICADELGSKAGLSVYVSALLAFGYAALVGVIVLLVRCVLKRCSASGERRKLLGFIVEAVLCVGLLALGLWLRIADLDAMTQSAAYFETAQVTYGQSIPQVVHGAVYLYLQVLHGLFVLVGNHFVAGIWLQIGIQMLAFLVLYFVVRKMGGAIAALITLAYGMCAPEMVQYALTLSPEMLYFLLMVLVLALFMVGCGKKLYPALFLLFGGLAAVMTYLDVAGVLLFLFAAAMPFAVREEKSGFDRKLAAIGCATAGFAGVFFGSILLDAFFSGKVFSNVLRAWGELYVRKPFVFSDSPFPVEEIILIGLLVFGIFSFWCDRREEIISVGMFNIIVLIFAMDFFTAEMPADLYCTMMLVILAGTCIGRVFTPCPAVVSVEETVTEEVAAEEVPMEVFADVEESGSTAAQPTIQFIENPLPLPKKHEKKVLNYAVELTEETAEFDIEVADDDDYDN